MADPTAHDASHAGAAAEVIVWVPVGRLAALIDAGSGLVSTGPVEGGRLLIDFEGNRYGASNIVTFADRVDHAWGRQSTMYPTAARLWPEHPGRAGRNAELVRVGVFDPHRGQVTLDGPAQESLLAGWLGAVIVDPAELTTTNFKHTSRRQVERMLATGDPVEREKARFMARTLHIGL